MHLGEILPSPAKKNSEEIKRKKLTRREESSWGEWAWGCVDTPRADRVPASLWRVDAVSASVPPWSQGMTSIGRTCPTVKGISQGLTGAEHQQTRGTIQAGTVPAALRPPGQAAVSTKCLFPF